MGRFGSESKNGGESGRTLGELLLLLLVFVRNTRSEGSAIDARRVRSVWRWTIRKVAPSASVSGEQLLAGKPALVGGNGD